MDAVRESEGAAAALASLRVSGTGESDRAPRRLRSGGRRWNARWSLRGGLCGVRSLLAKGSWEDCGRTAGLRSLARRHGVGSVERAPSTGLVRSSTAPLPSCRTITAVAGVSMVWMEEDTANTRSHTRKRRPHLLAIQLSSRHSRSAPCREVGVEWWAVPHNRNAAGGDDERLCCDEAVWTAATSASATPAVGSTPGRARHPRRVGAGFALCGLSAVLPTRSKRSRRPQRGI